MTKNVSVYVYDNVEVQLTGRKAKKTLKSGTVDVLHEISPRSSMAGSWKKWVKIIELFEIDDEDVDSITEDRSTW